MEHFTANYGEALNTKPPVEYAPKYDYDVLEKEKKNLIKTKEPLQKELRKLR